jgi:hypothetical protein
VFRNDGRVADTISVTDFGKVLLGRSSRTLQVCGRVMVWRNSVRVWRQLSLEVPVKFLLLQPNKAFRIVTVYLHSIFNLALERFHWSVSRPSSLTSAERGWVIHWLGGRLGHLLETIPHFHGRAEDYRKNYCHVFLIFPPSLLWDVTEGIV